jgi:hypothetical protein
MDMLYPLSARLPSPFGTNVPYFRKKLLAVFATPKDIGSPYPNDLPYHVKEFLIISNTCPPGRECISSCEEVIPMVFKFQCPECGKGEKSELVEGLPERKYTMKCGDCGCTYILTASADEEKKCEKASEGCSC